MRSAVVGLTGLCSLLLAFLALAASASAQDRRLVTGFDDNGDPLLNAYVDRPDRDSVLQWRSCPADGSSCVPLPQSAYQAAAGTRLNRERPGTLPAAPGETPAGTTFEAAYVIDGVPSTQRTGPWGGRMTITALPGMRNELQVGARVAWKPPTVSGGWNPEPIAHSSLELRRDIYVCLQPTGGDCVAIGTGRLRARYAGWYVFANYSRAWYDPSGAVPVDSSAPAGDFPFQGTFSATGHVDRLSAVSGALGPICCLPGTKSVDFGTPLVAPKATITARAPRRNGRTVVGSVTCANRCTVKFTVRGGGRPIVSRSINGRGKLALSVPRRHGRLRVSVIVDGTPAASGTTEAR